MNIPILDFGHGVDTPGKRSPVWEDGSQLFEWEFNRDIGMRIMCILEEKKIPYHICNEEYRDVSLDDRVYRCNNIYKYEKEMGNLAYIVSLHSNSFNGESSGWEIFTSKGFTKSDIIANMFYKRAEESFPEFRMRKGTSDESLSKEAGFVILRDSQCPAVLIESFFMDNERDCYFIMSNEGRNRIAQCYARVIEELLGEII